MLFGWLPAGRQPGGHFADTGRTEDAPISAAAASLRFFAAIRQIADEIDVPRRRADPIPRYAAAALTPPQRV